MSIKKLYILIFAFVLILLFSSCSNSANNIAAPECTETPQIIETPTPSPTMEELYPSHESGFNCMTYLYEKICCPTGLGYPQLTNEQIDELIASEDYKLIADTIKTFPDCANYFKRADFIFNLNALIDSNPDRRMPATTCSAWQTMQRREGQCASMSSCIKYILDGDYDEIGYISMPSHAEIYIKQDGIYYVINSMDYARNVENGQTTDRYISYIPFTECGSSSDFEECAKGFHQAYIITYVFDGPYLLLGPEYQNNIYPVPKSFNAYNWITNEPLLAGDEWDAAYIEEYYSQTKFYDESLFR